MAGAPWALCFAGPLLLDIDAGVWSSVAAVAACVLELAGIAAVAFEPCVRRLAAIEP